MPPPRSQAGDLIILEEAAYCDPGLISEVVVPLLSMSKSVLLCISTLLDGGNRARAQFLEDGKRHDLRGLDSRSHPLACARRLFQNVRSIYLLACASMLTARIRHGQVQPLRLAGPPALCQHPDFTRV